jgi:hypothetical protein
MNEWLPEGYNVPDQSSNYMKLKIGENRFRILAKPIMGWEYWTDEKDDKGKDKRKPNRVHMEESSPVEYADSLKHFWAMPVYNYETKSIQVLELTQKSLLKALTTLGRDKDWGSPLTYDIVIGRQGEGLETEYELIPKPKKELDKQIETSWKQLQDNGFDMDKLFLGQHPHPKS